MTDFTTVRCPELGDSYRAARLENGLTVLCCERPDRRGIYAVLAAGIGSATRDYLCGGRRRTLPAGTAHYLEHKLFAGKRGDAFELFAETGANANAYTSYDRTCYVFGANEQTERSLGILLDFVSDPYFTRANVDKERGIITEEMNMYLDSPDVRLLNEVLRMLYRVHPVSDEIVGTSASLAAITPELLYEGYHAFYRPANMVLAVAGCITAERVAELCRKHYRPALRGEAGRVLPAEEPDGVVCTRAVGSMAVSRRQFCIGFKERPIAGDRLRTELIFDLLCELICGESTDFYNELYDSGLINGSFFSDGFAGSGYFCTLFGGESDEPDRVLALLQERLAALRREGIDPDRLTEAIRSAWGDMVVSLDSNADIATALAYSSLKGYRIYDTFEALRTITADELQQTLLQSFDADRCCLYILNPIERS